MRQALPAGTTNSRSVVHEDAEHLAAAASQAAARVIHQAIAAHDRAAIVLATGNSQMRFLARLADETSTGQRSLSCIWTSTSG